MTAGTGRRWGRLLAGATSLTLAGGLAVAMGQADGFSAARLALASGQAWVASSRVGQIALIDGSTEQKVAAVTVARPGEQISVTQGGPDALVVNRTTGSLLRVRGSTYSDAPGAVRPLELAGPGLSVFAGDGQQAFAVDAARGVAVALDRASMTSSARPVSLAAQLNSGATVMDAKGRLWAVDTTNGDLVWFDTAGKHTRRRAAEPGAATRLTLVRGEPAIVDPAARQVTLLNPSTGDAEDRACLDVSATAQLRAGGSSSAALAFAVAPERGVLLVSDLDSGRCSRIVTLASPGSRLGDPVETGGRVFVPDYASGQVFVVDLGTDQVVGSRAVLPPGLTSFELNPRDGFVFYNDPLSQRSGVIRLDGSVQQISKYNPNNPSQQLRRPTRDTPSGQTVTGADASGQGSGSGGTGTDGPGSGAGNGSGSGRTPGRSQPSTPGTAKPGTAKPGQTSQPPPDQNQPAPGSVLPPGQLDPPPGSSGPVTGGPAAPGGGPAQNAALTISSAPPYTAGAPVTLQVAASDPNRQLSSASWDLGDSAAADGLQVTHTWTTPGPYTVAVQGVFTDGTTGSVSAPLIVTAPDAPPNQAPQAALAVTPPSGRVGVTVTADASGSSDPDGTIVSYSFGWADGQQSTSVTPLATHTYDSPCPACSVTVVVTDDRGATASATAPADIQPPPADQKPVAALAVAPGAVQTGQQVSASGAGSSDPEGPIEYQFAWGDGQASGWSSSASATHSYGDAGPQTVTLTVRDSAGQTATATAGVTVTTPPRDDPPVAALKVSPDSGSVNLQVTADATASTDDNDGNSLSYDFSWGDGDTSSNGSGRASHTFRSTGNRTVKVTVKDSKGKSDTKTSGVQVDPPPVHKSASVILSSATMWDLDTISDAFMSPIWEVSFGTDPDRGAVAVFDNDGVRVAKVSSASWDSCSGSLPAAPENGMDLDVGDILCISTDDGRLSAVQILSSDYSGRITTWEAPS